MSSEELSFAFDPREVNDTGDKLAPVSSKLGPNRGGRGITPGSFKKSYHSLSKKHGISNIFSQAGTPSPR